MIDIDDEALAAAARELGTSTKRDTVNAALRFIADRQARVAALLDDPLSMGIGEDLGDPTIRAAARR